MSRPKTPGNKLTPREQEIYNLLVLGFSVTEIADILFLSKPTIKTHLTHIYEKKFFEGKSALQKMICAHYKDVLSEMGVRNA